MNTTLFVGPTGSGKTYTMLRYAEYLAAQRSWDIWVFDSGNGWDNQLDMEFSFGRGGLYRDTDNNMLWALDGMRRASREAIKYMDRTAVFFDGLDSPLVNDERVISLVRDAKAVGIQVIASITGYRGGELGWIDEHFEETVDLMQRPVQL